MTLPKMAILISGTGTNMEAILKACNSGELQAEVTFVGSDRANAKGLDTAASYGIETRVFNYKNLGRETAEEAISKAIEETKSQWIVLAGFMRVLLPSFVKRYEGKIINIHPSLLPSFPGAHGIEDAWNAGVDVSGVTVHIVDEKVDNGPILAQQEVKRLPGDTMDTFEARIHEVEHKIYKATLKEFFEDNPLNN